MIPKTAAGMFKFLMLIDMGSYDLATNNGALTGRKRKSHLQPLMYGAFCHSGPSWICLSGFNISSFAAWPGLA
jgi:hypothetical protein